MNLKNRKRIVASGIFLKMIVKNYTYKLLLAFLVLCLSCGEAVKKRKAKKEAQARDLPHILQSKKLQALVDNSSTSYFVYRGVPMGFEYELLGAFAKHLDVELEIILIEDLDRVVKNLKDGEADIIAANLTVTQDRQKQIAFSEDILRSKQVLVQHKLKGKKIVEKPSELDDSLVFVRRHSSFYDRLENLNEELGVDIKIKQAPGNTTVEKLMQQVNDGVIHYTVADEHIAKINKAYLRNIDISVPISLEQKVAWAVRKNATQLLDTLDQWLGQFKKTLDFRMIYLKYYGNTQLFRSRLSSELFTSKSGTLSPYDKIVQAQAKRVGWDWRLLVSLIYQESGFEPTSKAWTGAYGLMQLMPETAKSFGVDSSSSPEENIAAGIKYLEWLDKEFEEKVPDSTERISFVLAAYNVGLGHVFDAIRLAEKHGLNPQVWKGNVAEMLLNKSQPEYYKDKVVYYGYCRGTEPYKYVNEVWDRFEHYRNMTDSIRRN